MKFANDSVLSAGDMSASVNSDNVKLDQIYGFSFHAIFTGAPVGTFKLQASNDPSAPTNWADIPDSEQPVVGSGDIFWNYNGAFYKWVRVVYSRTSGTGTCNVTYSSKGA